jgi:hypothetical protein
MDDESGAVAWLEIHDEEFTAVSLQQQIETNLTKRRQEHGRVTIQFPTFGYIAAMPQPPSPQYAPNLYHHLNQLNQMALPDVSAELVPTASTRLPIIGRLWQIVRGQFHNLILFYVNRSSAYNQQSYNHVTNVLNELTRLVQEQRQMIEELETAVQSLQNYNHDD